MKKASSRLRGVSVKIRFRQLADGRKSIYLDIYSQGKRRYEFLKLYVLPEHDEEAARANARTTAPRRFQMVCLICFSFPFPAGGPGAPRAPGAGTERRIRAAAGQLRGRARRTGACNILPRPLWHRQQAGRKDFFKIL